MYISHATNSITYEEFVRKELIHFSFADNKRSIPSVIDGLKPSQRKVLFGCFKKKLDGEMKVVQLAGYIADKTCYHHGEQSLYLTIVNMAQDFVGSNNVPLLTAAGQFGTRARVRYFNIVVLFRTPPSHRTCFFYYLSFLSFSHWAWYPTMQ